MINLYLVTPLLGFLKNYSKYKQINFYVFIRTPILYFFIHNILLYLRYTELFFTNTLWPDLKIDDIDKHLAIIVVRGKQQVIDILKKDIHQLDFYQK